VELMGWMDIHMHLEIVLFTVVDLNGPFVWVVLPGIGYSKALEEDTVLLW